MPSLAAMSSKAVCVIAQACGWFGARQARTGPVLVLIGVMRRRRFVRIEDVRNHALRDAAGRRTAGAPVVRVPDGDDAVLVGADAWHCRKPEGAMPAVFSS